MPMKIVLLMKNAANDMGEFFRNKPFKKILLNILINIGTAKKKFPRRGLCIVDQLMDFARRMNCVATKKELGMNFKKGNITIIFNHDCSFLGFVFQT